MKNNFVDILVITHKRPYYTKLALNRLLDTCGTDPTLRVWLWHNGNHKETLALVKSYCNHPRVHKFYHSPENKQRKDPTNWLWDSSDGEFLVVIDDDCLMPYGWADKLRQAHIDIPRLGVVGTWMFYEEDFVARLAKKKLRSFAGGHRIMMSLYVQGSGQMMKKECVLDQGLLQDGESFQDYCYRLAENGWFHGWYFPFLFMDHMDDPRSPYTLMKSEADYQKQKPLSSTSRPTLDDWLAGIRMNAWRAQAHNPDIRWQKGWRKAMHNFANRIRWKMGVRKIW